MICPHCGTELEDYTTFCSNCGKIVFSTKKPAASSDTAPSSGESTLTEDNTPKKVAQRLYPPPEPEAPAESQPEPEEPAPAVEKKAPSVDKKAPSPKKGPKYNPRLVLLTIIMGIITAVAIGAAVYVVTNTHSLRVELTKAQTERASAQASVESLGKQVAELEAALETVKEERDSLSGEVSSLTSQINAMESSVNQSSYDKETAERELAEAQEDVKALSQQITEVQATLTETETKLAETEEENKQLQEDYDTMKATVKGYEDEVGFYDTYVVFVMLSSDTKYYHKYDCEDFTKRNFLAYSTKLAEANGYSACPKCKD